MCHTGGKTFRYHGYAMSNETKRCPKCERELPTEQFNPLVLEFDHIEAESKDYAMSELSRTGRDEAWSRSSEKWPNASFDA